MRYLWIEDFNDGSITADELEARLKGFFDLGNDKIIIKKDLSSAVSFLEERENIHEIDAFLIDIRFPEGSTHNLYERYFKDIVTKRFFDGNIEDASGIMLYLLLVFRYHISQKKMAFISANISSNNDKIRMLREMEEIIIKSKYEELSYDDRECYRKDERRIGKDTLHISSKEKEWPTFIGKENQINENVNIEELLEAIRALPYKYENEFETADGSGRKSGSGSQVKYNNLKNQFDKIGFAMPSAFEKPKIGTEEKAEKRYSFLEWESRIHREPYNAVRSNVLEMCIILNRNLGKVKSLYKDFINLLTCDAGEKANYDETFFARYLDGIKGMFPIECDIDVHVQCERAVKEIAALWEACAAPEFTNTGTQRKRHVTVTSNNWKGKTIYKFEHTDSCYYACHAALKMVRNWSGHQGIANVNIEDAGFIFLVCMRGIFDIAILPEEEKRQYIECEENILSLFPVEANVNADITGSLTYFCNLNNAAMGKPFSSREIYDKISGLGNAESKIRREVSMDEIYMLFYHTARKGNCYGEYGNILKCITTRTWKDWQLRYDNRFAQYCHT